MANAAIFWDNLIDDATLTASSEASTDLAVTNLQSFQLSEKWRTLTRQDEWIQADLGSTQFIPSSFLIRHNLTASATIRVRISANSDMSSPVYDVTFYAWPSLEGYDEDIYDGSRYIGYDGAPIVYNDDGTLNFQEFQLYTALVHSDTAYAVTITTNDESYAGRYIRWDITDQANPRNYIELGWLGCGDVLQPTYDIDWNNSIAWVDPSQIFTNYGQNVWINKRNKFRTAAASWGFLSQADARTNFNLLGAIAGGSKPVVFMQYFENTLESYSTTLYCIIETPINIRQVRKQVDHYSYAVDMSFRELL